MRRQQATQEEMDVRSRFFEALGRLTRGDEKVMRGRATFCRAYGINRRNLWAMERNPGAGILDPAWLTYLVRDFGVSAHWLLTGRGEWMRSAPDGMQDVVNNYAEKPQKVAPDKVPHP